MKKLALITFCFIYCMSVSAQDYKSLGDAKVSAGDWTGAAAFYELGMEKDDKCAFSYFLLIYEKKIEVQYSNQLSQIILPLAMKENPEAQFYFGMMCEEGYGVPKNINTALYWFQRSAELGHAKAQYHLGFIYEHGVSISKDIEKALEWYRLAAAQGNEEAIFNIERLTAIIDVGVPIEEATRAPTIVPPNIQFPTELLSIQKRDIYNSDGLRLKNYEVKNIMNNVPIAFDFYSRGKKQKTAGGIFLGLGILGSFVGTTALITTVQLNNDEYAGKYYENDLLISVSVLLGSQLCFILPAISLISKGNSKIKNAVDAYNRDMNQTSTSDISLSFGLTRSGGIGLTFNF